MFLAALLGFLAMGSLAFAQDGFFIVIPNDIRPGMTFGFEVNLMVNPAAGSSMTISIRETLSPESQLLWDTAMQTVSLTPGKMIYSGEFMAKPDLYSGACNFIHVQWSRIKLPGKIQQLCIKRPESPIFVVTDKPIYKPGDMVLYMAGLFDEMLKPKQSEYKVQIQDPDGNLIMQKTMDPQMDGFQSMFKGELQISNNPIQGEYSITVESIEDYSYSVRKFKVEEYVLPKFEVMINLDPAYVVSKDGQRVSVKGTVISKYTYGQNVNGIMKLYVNKNLKVTENTFSGIQSFDVPMTVNVAAMDHIELNLFAEVFESHTNIVANASAVFSIYKSNIAASVVKPIPYRSDSDKSYSCQIELTSSMGGPLTEFDGPESLDLSNYELGYSVGIIEQLIQVTSNPVELNISSVMGDMRVDITDKPIKVWFKYTSQDGSTHESPKVEFTPVLYSSMSNQVMHIQLKDTTNQNEVCFTISPCALDDKIFYQVINNYYPEHLQEYSCPINDNPVCFNTNHMHAPMSMIIAYKVVTYLDRQGTSNMEMLSSSVKFKRPFTTQQNVRLSVTPSTQRPGEDATVGVRTNSQAMVGLIGVDKSVELLADPNDLTLKELEHAVTAYRRFENQRVNPFPNPPILVRGPAVKQRAERSIIEKRSVCWGCGGLVYSVDAGLIIEEAGLRVISSIPFMDNTGDGGFPWMEGDFVAQALPMEKNNQNDKVTQPVDDDGAVEEKPARVRSNFQEVWLWDLVSTDPSGSYSLSKAVPDTITSWNLKAFAFNQADGLGVAAPVQMTVFQELFVYMNLPYSVVRGEEFNLQILVFNYKDTVLEVTAKLESNSGFTVITSSGQTAQQLLSQTLRIEPGTSAVAVVPISPTRVGELVLTASATATTNSANKDIEERRLKVKAEGYERSDSAELSPVKFPGGAGEVAVSMANLLSLSTEDMVDDSFKMYLSVTGDMMGPVIANLEGLTTLPTGCGEQNIKTLAPSVMVAMYLKSINRFDGDLKSKCQKYAGTGYIRQLRYKHTEGESVGGYSAWGQNGACTCRGEAPDPNPGSTWLTAFVLKMFSLLAQQDLTFISRVPLQQAVQYLMRRMKTTENSLFVEEGNVIHTEMQGGTNAGIGLTAFCVQALMEALDVAVKDKNDDLAAAITTVLDQASGWLSGKSSYLTTMKKPYQLALTAYALARYSKAHNDRNYQAAKTMLDAYEAVKDDMEPPPLECPYMIGLPRCMESSQSQCKSNSECSNGQLCCYNGCAQQCMNGVTPYHTTGPSKTEMNGYAMMAYTKLAALVQPADQTMYNSMRDKVEQLAAWLLERRKAGGNYESTQDTVVALEALARRGIQFPDTTQSNFRVAAKVGSQYVSDWISVNSDNYIVSQQLQLDVGSMPSTLPDEIKLVYEGTSGTAFTSVEAIYNTLEPLPEPAFDVDVVTFIDSLGDKVVQVCAKNKDSSNPMSSMVVVSVSCGSGLVYDGIPEFSSQFKVSRAEADESECKVTWYYDVKPGDSFDDEHCYKFKVMEDYAVEKRKPGSVAVTDYYNTVNTAQRTFMADFSGKEPGTTRPTTAASQIQLSMVGIVMATFFTLAIAVFFK